MQLMNIRYKTVQDFYLEEFPGVIIDWVKNTEDLRYRMDFDEVEFNGYSVYRAGEKELTIVEYKETNTIAALHRDRDLYGTEFLLSVVFKPDNHELFIRMTNSKSTEDGKFVSKFRKPDIIDELVYFGILEMDYDIKMLYNKPHYVKEGCTSEFLSILNRSAKFTLPVIYVALGPCNCYALNPEELAEKYSGMAHVFVQDDKECFSELIGGTKGYVPKNGEVAIYYPSVNLKEAHFEFNKYDEESMKRAISKAICFFYHHQNFGPNTTFEDIASTAVSIRNSNLKKENMEVYEENKRVVKENREIINTFDYDLKKSDEEMEKIRKRMKELEVENEILKRRIKSIDSVPLLYYGEEKELYAGEIKELLIDILSNVTLNEGSRRKDIISDLLKANVIKPTIKDRHNKLKAAFNDYRDLNTDLRTELEELGFEISSEGKHHKLTYYGDSRYQTTLAKTSSDYRSGMNAVSNIIKNMM